MHVLNDPKVKETWLPQGSAPSAISGLCFYYIRVLSFHCIMESAKKGEKFHLLMTVFGFAAAA